VKLMADRLRVVVSDDRGRPIPVRGLASWLRRVAPARARGTVGVAIVSDTRVRALNRTYRRKDYATDVLSFPAGSESRPNRESRPNQGSRSNHGSRPNHGSRLSHGSSPNPRARPNPESRIPNPDAYSPLGDIVIARGVARRQARQAGHAEATELRILALHGLLHLLGYDHERDNGRMAREEKRLRRKGGLRDGLIERSHL
jgi:probable rRNA maturation factor